MLCGWTCRWSLLGLLLGHDRPLRPGPRLCTERATEWAQGVRAPAAAACDYPPRRVARKGRTAEPPHPALMHLPELILSPLHIQTLPSSPSSSLFSTEF